jgi:hypothetical protein
MQLHQVSGRRQPCLHVLGYAAILVAVEFTINRMGCECSSSKIDNAEYQGRYLWKIPEHLYKSKTGFITLRRFNDEFKQTRS